MTTDAEQLVIAIMEGDAEAFDRILARGVEVNAAVPWPDLEHPDRKDGYPVTPVCMAVVRNQTAMVEALLKAGARPEQNSVDPIIEASANGNVDIGRMLLDAGSDPNAASPAGHSALMASVTFPEATRLLLARGAAIERETEDGMTALFSAVRQCGSRVDVFSDSYEDYRAGKRTLVSSFPSGERPYQALGVLLEHGADVNHQDKKGRTVLAQARTPRAAKMLIEAGARLDIKDNEGHDGHYQLEQNGISKEAVGL